ncbi:MAG: AAA family ATPase, partial [Clostridiales bacterium]|nr:AAA family ATPase [Clostridiales bacterium]
MAHRLANEGKFFFLSRPRRFGKSLLLSTLASYFDGRRDLFRGLAVERLEKDWARHPVLHIDLNVRAYRNAEDLDIGLDTNLRMYEEKWEITPGRVDAAARFFDLIQHAYRKTGQKAVVLIDEYDRPLIQTMERGIPNDDMRAALKGFYGVLKSADQWLRFVMLTGVTKFSKVSVFSDLNMLEDISMSDEYACLCGISARELEACFGPELESLAEKNGMTYGEAVAEMKKNYDGYHFSKDSEAVFNPFSALRALKSKEFSFYWFRTGTPTFLIDALKEARYDLMGLAEGVKIPEESIDDYRTDGGNLAPLLYQSGYLTICGYGDGMYSLAFPNAEVRCGFLQELLRYCTQGLPVQEFYVGLFMGDLRSGDVDAFMERMRALIAKIPYEFGGGKERQCQFIFYLLFT